MKPEELVKAMEALKEACSSVSPDLVKNPHGQKPTNLGKPKSQLYDVMKGVYLAMEGITNLLSSLGFEEKEERVVKVEEKVLEVEEKVLDLESDKDVLAQKWKVGTIILQSNKKGRDPMVKPEKEVEEGELVKHATFLVKAKTGVIIEEGDLSKCHFVPGGGLKVKFKEVRRGSKFHKVVDAIKRPTDEQKNMNLYANFELTKKRNGLLFEVRKAKRENRIAKYFVDFDGNIEVQINMRDKERVRLTRQSEVFKPMGGGDDVTRGFDTKQPARTFTPEAFRQLLA